MPDDAAYMREALRLGRRGLGRVSPNPPVGAVVVRGGRIVGRGFHRRAGGPHAEVEALGQAGAAARGATLYVTLEPCAHFGRTPPCTDAVRASGIARLVFGCRDPNPRVAGGGAGKLARAGLQVQGGVLAAECGELIGAFRKAILTGVPWVSLKLAASLDGRIATADGDSRWVTGEAARRLTHRWRDTHDAVLVGAETVRRDDPALTCRVRGGRDPLRVVLDGRLRLPADAQLLSPAAAGGTVIITGHSAPEARARRLRQRGATVLRLADRDGRVSMRAALRALARRGVSSVLVEGGGEVAAATLRERLVDRLFLFYAPKLVGAEGRPMVGPLRVTRMAAAPRLEVLGSRWIGGDLLIEARPFPGASQRV